MDVSSEDSCTVSSEKESGSAVDEVLTTSASDSENVFTETPATFDQTRPILAGEKGEIAEIIASGRRPFDVILKGGAPWGFALNGGAGTNIPLIISKIVDGGKASESALVEGDYLICVNETPCSSVGEALDIVDTADNILTLTVLRGHRSDFPASSSLVSQSQSYLSRAFDFKKKERSVLNQFNDDSLVYSESRSSQLQKSVGMRPAKKRGESFNVRRQNEANSSSRKDNRHAPNLDPSSWPQPIDSRKSLPTDSRAYHDRNSSANVSKSTSSSLASQMNRRRSEGHGLSSHRSQQQHHHQQQQQQPLPQHQQQSNLLSMKSSPNLTQANEELDHSRDGHFGEQSSMTGVKPSPSMPGDLYKQQSGWCGGNPGALSYTSNMCNTDMESSNRANTRRSLPFYNIHRYMPDYENVNHLGTTPLRSEKISEIDDIDEVTGKNSLPNSPSPKALSPHQHLHGDAGPPTRDPSTLKYLKVNQSHEKYPSWPVTKPNGASEQSQSINSRAVSMTDHTNTSKEFPQKQVLAYTPGLNSLAEKNSPTSERKGEDGKYRNTSDPGFKSEFVYDRFGRVQRKNYDNVEQKFDDFYNNSKPGYPPPNMDSDGHNIGDKDYNAPSPPERESKGVNEKELSNRLDSIQSMPKTSEHQRPYERGEESGQSPRSEKIARPSQLNINLSHSTPRVDSGTSPLEASSSFEPPLSASSTHSPRQARNADQTDSHGPHSGQQQRYSTRSQNPMSSGFRNEKFTYQGGGGAINPGRSRSQREPSSSNHKEPYTPIDRSRPASYTSPSGVSAGSADSNKGFIVKPTPYYNTSTQTEMMPYAVKISSPLSNQAGNKWRNAEIQVGNFGTQTSPQSPGGDQRGKLFEEKSIQARMSRDFQGSELDSSLDKISPDQNKNTTVSDYFKYPPSSALSTQTTQFLSREGIQAKYATDENPTDSADSSTISGIPHFSDNSAPILRKLSEEFYGGRLSQMQQDKRSMSSTSSQEMSPRHDTSSLSNVFHQPGMREAESYNSVVIHHDVSNNALFGRDDYAGSVSSMGDSRNDISFSDTSSNYKASDYGAPRARNSLDPSFGSQKGRLLMQQQLQDSSRSGSGYKHIRENSAPVSSSAYSHWLSRSSGLSSSADYLTTDSAISSGSDVSSLTSQSRSSSSDPRFFGSISSSMQSSMSPLTDKSGGSDGLSMQNKQPTSSDNIARNRLSSDSVFEPSDDKDNEEDPENYQFIRKPSLRKAYGIYDETERLISQNKIPGKAPEHMSFGGDPNATYAVVSRPIKFSDSLGLGQIKEEGDPSANEDDTKMPSSSAPKSSSLEGRVVGRREEKLQKHQYAWQSESWRKGRPEFDMPRGSNLKRTTSEQIAMPKGNIAPMPSSYDAEMTSLSTQHPAFQASKSNVPSHMTRSQSESGTFGNPNEAELKKVQQQAVLSFYQRKATAATPSGSNAALSSPTGATKDTPSPDSSPYESIGSQRSTTESVSDIISKANENLAKSAQRVDSIRRSNSASSRHSGDFSEIARHDRMRKETEWSRLRTSGSIRYSPEHHSGIRSNRSSFASENHYEDISLFAPSASSEESKEEKNNERAQPESNMDTGVMSSPTYLNIPVKRRPPPPLPTSRSPSPESPPPALPPRNYNKESIHNHYNNAPNATTTNNNYNKPAIPTPSSQPMSVSGGRANAGSLPPQRASDAIHRARTMPLAKSQPFPMDEEPTVDNSKRDFKSLMSQWENNSPREERYAAELRQAQLRLNTQKQSSLPNHSQQAQHNHHQQQQQQHHPPQSANAMPMSVKHSRPPISLATTYKREPTLPQEATSPLSSSASTSSSSAILPPSSSNFASSHYQSSNASSSSASSSSSSLPMPNYSVSPTTIQSSPAASTALNKQQPLGGTGASAQHYQSSNQPGPHTVTTSNLGNHAFLSSSSAVTALPPQIPHKVSQLEETRKRSGSDLSSSPGQSQLGSGSNRSAPFSQPFRERSSSEHDILGDRYKGAASTAGHFNIASSSPSSSSSSNIATSSNASMSPKETTTKWRPKRGPLPPPPPPQPSEMEETDMANSDFPPPPPDEGFAEDSYIGHKNKTSRPIGTYKRSKSAAVLQTDNNNYKIAGETDNSKFPEKALAHQSWNSESMLQSHLPDAKGPTPVSALPGDRIGSIPEHLAVNNADTLPARPPTRVPNSSRQFPLPSHDSSNSLSSPPSSSSASPSSAHNPSSHTSPSSSVNTTAGDTPIFTARPFVIEQPGWIARRESPRRQPPPVPNSPPFDPDAPQFPQDPSPHAPPPVSNLQSHDLQQTWSNQDGAPSQYSQQSPHRQGTTTPGRSPAWNSSYRSPTTASPVLSSPSSQTNSIQNHHYNNKSPTDDAPPLTPPRDFNRRDSAPARPVVFDSRTPPSAADIHVTLAHRRLSESSVTNTSRSDNDNSDLSTLSSSGHTRQPSQEELECDLKAKQLAQNLEDKDQKLSEVLRQDASKKRMHYMDGLFNDGISALDGSTPADRSTQSVSPANVSEKDKNLSSISALGTNDHASPTSNSIKNDAAEDNGRRQNLPKEYWMSAPKALVEMQVRQNQEMVKDLTRDIKDNNSLMKQKEELLDKLSKKLDVLEEDKISVQKEISQNDDIGVQVFDLIQSKCPGQGAIDKVKTFNDDQEKIVRLMLNLSGQLARAENAVQALGQNADAKAKKLANDKLTRQRSKYEEAKSIKDDMDRRKEQVTNLVQEHLDENESKLFALFILKKPQLTIELQDLEDKIKLGREQMDELKKSIPENKSTS